MYPTTITLTPTGFFVDEYNGDKDTYVKVKLELNRESLLSVWNAIITIGEGTTFGHVCSILRRMSDDTINALEQLTNSSISSFLGETTKIFPIGDSQELYALEIYRSIDVNNWDTCDEGYEYSSHMSCHGLGKPLDGIDKKCDTYALEFTPWYELRNLPLIMLNKAYVSMTTWKIVDIDTYPIVGDDGKEVVSSINSEWKTSITLGEFLVGLFDEISFFGSPEQRDKQLEKLEQNMKTEKAGSKDSDRGN